MGWWSERCVPKLVDRALDSEEFAAYRARACADLHGSTLELGFGSGLNLAHCPASVERILAVEPSDVGWRLSATRRAESRVPVERVGLDGAALPLPSASVDACLSTWTLCTIPDVDTALAEVVRVLRPGGRFHFVEHGLSPEPRVARWQRRLDPWQQRLLGGCHLTRDIAERIRAAGFVITAAESAYLPGPASGRPFSYLTFGSAAVASS